MVMAVLTMSHSPLIGYNDPPDDVRLQVEEAFDRARRFVENFDPDLVVLFGPDHFNGMFYDTMPPFCIGTAARSIGDWSSSAGEISVDSSTAKQLAAEVLGSGVDIAISARMEVDHGFAQPLDIIFGGIANVPVVPIFINSAAEPFCPVSRIHDLGTAVGRALAGDSRRILIMGSGGLSHDPPVPRLEGAPPEVAERLINGRNPSADAVAKRVENVVRTSRELTAGTATIRDLNPEWDLAFLDLIEKNKIDETRHWSNESFVTQAGVAAHEVRTWIAAYAAARAVGIPSVEYRFYKPITEWIAGFAVTTATVAESNATASEMELS